MGSMLPPPELPPPGRQKAHIRLGASRISSVTNEEERITELQPAYGVWGLDLF